MCLLDKKERVFSLKTPMGFSTSLLIPFKVFFYDVCDILIY